MQDETLTNLINRVRTLTAMGPDQLTDDLILAMHGSAEDRAYRIMEYRKGHLIVDSD